MGQAFYRKYRSKSLNEIVGQEHIITTLRNALKKGAISHAYLFTGPRGVGKTSIARIWAHEVNGLEYNEETPHLDIIEIDAASNRRIDEIRDLRDKVHVAPTSAKYKVYIIDEVHMLTKEAFNALLKTLEEPPAHAIFILATTEVHKLPETIISRTQRYTFKPIERGKAVEHMRFIADQEGVKISDEALMLIAEHGDGSFRDSISLLDQISHSGSTVEADHIRTMLGIAPNEMIDELYGHVMSGTPKDVLESLKAAEERGFEPGHLAKQLSALLRHQMLTSTLNQPQLATQLLGQLIDVPASSDPSIKLEVTLLGINFQAQPNAIPQSSPAQEVAAPKPKPKTETHKPQAAAAEPTVSVAEPAKKVVTPKPEPEPTAAAPKLGPSLPIEEAWASTLEAIRQKYNTLYGVLRMAEPHLAEDTLTLGFRFAFHQKRINEAKNKQLVIEILTERLGRPVNIQCTLQKDATPALEPVASAAAPVSGNPGALETISNIFGGAEVLES